MRSAELLLLGLALGVKSTAKTPASAQSDTVVLLHGLGRSSWSMKRIEWSLRDAGYTVVNLDYPSRDFPIETLAEAHLGPSLAQLKLEPGVHVHFVTHSMGGIVLRCYLRDHPLPQLGRIVMLGPPNSGSEIADHLKSSWFYRTMNGPAGQQLGTDGLPGKLGPAPGETGIIAGEVSLNPFFSSWMPGPSDGKVSVARARLDGMADFLTVPYSHTWLMWREPVIDQVREFLRNGKFKHPAPAVVSKT
jgi:pimeloyl-ACP methyl ester carboxylesterase